MKRTALKRRTRLRPMSAKRQRERAVYLRKRNEFLRVNPVCLVGWCDRPATDVHHKAGRVGSNYVDESTFLPVCRGCHMWIHNNPAEARSLGLLQ